MEGMALLGGYVRCACWDHPQSIVSSDPCACACLMTPCTEQANTLFASILHTEVTPEDTRPVSPVRSNANADDPTTPAHPTTPSRRRIFNFTSPSRSSRSNPTTPRRLDTPANEVYSLSPVRAESRRLLQSPKRLFRNINKTPYRVLDAPDLADDFYLNLLDWSQTDTLAVGLSQNTYLWTAPTATVHKLCDLQSEQDTISSLSWAQKVCNQVLCSMKSN